MLLRGLAVFTLAALAFAAGLALAERWERSPLRADPTFQDARDFLRLAERASEQGRQDLARAAYRAALELSPDDAEARAQLGFLLYEAGRDDEAVAELERAREGGAQVALIDLTLGMMRARVDEEGPFPRFTDVEAPAAKAPAEPERLAARDPTPEEDEEPEPEPEPDLEDAVEDALEPEELPGPPVLGDCEVALERRADSGTFLVDVHVDGAAARLILDTGASLTVLSRDFVDDARLSFAEDGVLMARTAAGPRRFATGRVSSFEVAGRVIEGLRVALCDECGMPGSDGLLGLDVQEPLGMSLQPGQGIVRFGDCEP